MPSALTMKLVGGLVALLLVLGLIAERGRWMHRAHSDEATMAAWCTEVRAAADNPKLDCKRTGEQIIALGESIAAAKTAIAHQNAAVDALKVEGDRQQAAAAEASHKAAGRAQTAQAASTRLEASSRAGGAPCEPSAALKGAWK